FGVKVRRTRSTGAQSELGMRELVEGVRSRNSGGAAGPKPAVAAEEKYPAILARMSRPIVFFLFVLPCFAVSDGQTRQGSSAGNTSAINTAYQQGLSAIQAGDLGAARGQFEKVIRLAPRSPEAHNSLGWVLFSQGELEDAIRHFRTALQLRPKLP